MQLAEASTIPYQNVPSQDQEQFVKSDKSYIQSNLIETWSMSWWGFQKGNSALVVIVETPDDAAYKFEHPAGGPTVLGPRWLAVAGPVGLSAHRCGCAFSRKGTTSRWPSGIAAT